MKKILPPFLMFGIFVAGIFLYSTQNTFSQTTDEPVAPSDLTVSYFDNLDGTFTVELSWTDNEPNQNNNEIHWAETSGTGQNGMSAVGDITSYTYSSVAQGTYDYKVRACTSVCSSFSNVVTITLDSGSGGTNPPSAPVLNSPQVSGSDVFLTWSDSDTEETYNVYRGIDSASLSSITQGSSLPADSTSYTDSALADDTYYYMVKACNLAGCTESNTVNVTIDTTNNTTEEDTTNEELFEEPATTEETKIIKGTVKYSTGIAVTDAMVEAYNAGSGLAAGPVQTSSTGSYSLSVSGGAWDIYIYPATDSANWSYNDEPKNVSFNDDNTTETKTKDFVVSLTNAKITGRVLLPDGSAPSANTVFVSFDSSEFSYGTPVGSNGYFEAAVKEGTYSMFIHLEDSLYSSPDDLPAVSVNAGDIHQMGDIKLVENTSLITGTVTGPDGPAAGVEVNAWQPEGAGYASGKTDISGTYTLSVTGGIWEVYPRLDSLSNLQNSGHPKRVDVSSNSTVGGIDFTLVKTDATLAGTVTDASDNTLTDAYGWAGLSRDIETDSGFGAPIENGKFTISAPAGTYDLFLHFPPDSKYIQTESVTAALNEGSNSISVSVTQNTSVITGALKDEFGITIKGIEARVFATTGDGIWQDAAVDSATGQYKLKVSEGTWYLGYKTDSESGYISSDRPNIEVNVIGASVTKDITIKRAGAKIQGIVQDPDGKGIAGVFVGVSEVSFKEAASSDEHKDPIIAGAKTDSSGNYSINVPSGDYYVKTFVSHLSGWLAAKEQNVTLSSDSEIQIRNFKLRRPSVKIKGTVYRKLDAVSGAFVWAWSETGGFQATKTDTNGKYEISATPNEEWVVAASKDINGELFRSEEVPVFVGDNDISRILEVTRSAVIPRSQTKTTDSAETSVVKIEDGTSVTIPANSISSSGSVSVSISPDTRISSQGRTKVAGLAYDMVARDSSGQRITNFRSDVTISIPYKDIDLSKLGISEDKLSLGFWDEASGVWRIKDSFALNSEKNVVTGATNHFTRFALLTVVPTVDTSSIADGDLIKTADNPDVYIAKKIGNKKFKRLILNPDIFNAYGHLEWGNIKIVSQAQMDAFVLSGLTIEVFPDGTPVNGNVYQVSSDAGTDVGVSRWVNMPAQAFESAGFDWDSIYHINEFEASPDFYPAGPPITSA